YKSYKGMPADVTGEPYYEFLYWGSGHILQFNHSLLMLLAWLVLMLLAVAQSRISGKFLLGLAVLTLLPVFDAFRIYFAFDIFSGEHRVAFTNLMKFGGLATLPLGLYLAYLFVSSWSEIKNNALIKAILFSSATLFLTGGVIGFLIEGVNVVI